MTQEGVLLFKIANIGSKSEELMPFLYIGKGEFLQISKYSGLSLSEDILSKFDGKRVVIQGQINEYNVFLIEKIEEIDTIDPKIKFE